MFNTNLLRYLWGETVTLAKVHTICTRTVRSCEQTHVSANLRTRAYRVALYSAVFLKFGKMVRFAISLHGGIAMGSLQSKELTSGSSLREVIV